MGNSCRKTRDSHLLESKDIFHFFFWSADTIATCLPKTILPATVMMTRRAPLSTLMMVNIMYLTAVATSMVSAFKTTTMVRRQLQRHHSRLFESTKIGSDENKKIFAKEQQSGGKNQQPRQPRRLERELNVEQFESDLDRFSEEMDESFTVTSTIPWKFQGMHEIHCQVSRPGRTEARSEGKQLPAVLLVHGFGSSVVSWRETIRTLTKAGHTVYAMDLLGHGKSAKPTTSVHYSTNLWAQQLDDFCKEHLHLAREGDKEEQQQQLVLVGNSIGSIIALLAATGEFASGANKHDTTPYIRQHVAGIGMFNSGIGMNVRSMTRDPKWNSLQRFVLNAMFDGLENHIFGNISLLQWILDKVITKEVLRKTLLELYPSLSNGLDANRVDDELVESFYQPAKDDTAAAAHVLSQILTNEAGLTPMEVYSKHYNNEDNGSESPSAKFLNNLPVHVVWGDADTVTPIDGVGEVGQFYRFLANEDMSNDNKVTLEVIKGAGHLLFDEVPDLANGSLLQWLKKL